MEPSLQRKGNTHLAALPFLVKMERAVLRKRLFRHHADPATPDGLYEPIGKVFLED